MQMKKRIQAIYTKLKVHRWIAWLLCAALMCSMVNSTLPALAIDGEKKEDTLCEHHPEHTEECGYAEAVEGQPCTHIHDDQCGYVGEGSTAIECNHEHDEECGYVEAAERKPCRFVCEICDESEEDLGEETEPDVVMAADEISASAKDDGSEEVTDEETEQDVAVMADEPMALAAAQEEGLIAEFKFDDVSNRLRNSANSGITASLHRVVGGQAAPGEGITDLSGYFESDGSDGDALHLENNACLVLNHIDAFKSLNELTIEMRVNITSAQGEHWLFYATPDGAGAVDTDNCFGAVIRDYNKQLRTIRNNKYQVNWDSPDGVLKLDNWHNIKVVYKVSTMALYIDGKRVQEYGAGGKTADYFVDGTVIWLGHSAFTKDTNFDGYIDDIKIYSYAIDDYSIDEEKYIVEGVDPENTTVHMFDYWITGQLENDFDPPIRLANVRDGEINKSHLFLFAGWNAAAGDRLANSSDSVGSWNCFEFDQGNNSVTQGTKRAKCEPLSGIVENHLINGYPQLALEGLKNTGLFWDNVDQSWYNSVGKSAESLDYLFDPSKSCVGKAVYPNVTGLFRLDEDGYYYFRCAETFAELNRDQNRRPKKSTGNNRITLYKRDTKYKDFFPFNDATDLFYITMDGKLDKANGGTEGMGVQATTDEPFNHYFGMTVETEFQQPIDGKIDRSEGKQPMIFDFSGDDDVWIFIDDILVADLGGLHEEVRVNIDFSTGIIDFTGNSGQKLDGTDSGGRPKSFDTTLYDMFDAAGRADDIEWNEVDDGNKLFANGSAHTLKFFYLERGNAASRCTISFNLQKVAKDSSTSKKSKKDDVPVEPIFEEFVTLDVSTEELPKKKEETKEIGVLASPNTGDSNMVGLWLALLALSTAGLAAIHRSRRRGSK